MDITTRDTVSDKLENSTHKTPERKIRELVTRWEDLEHRFVLDEAITRRLGR